MDYAELNAERVFLEGLLQQRFNFFIVAFSLVIAAGTAAGSKSELNFVLIVGLLFCVLLGLCTNRVFLKVDAVLKMLHQFENHAMHRVHNEAIEGWRWWHWSFPVNGMMGRWVPLFSVGVILVWAALANFDVIEVK